MAVVLPSRGLMASRMAESLDEATRGRPCVRYYRHALPLPDCFNDPIRSALQDARTTHIWTVEEDVVVPPNALDLMLDIDKDISAVDYPIRCADRDGNKLLSSYCFQGSPLWVSLGCTLIRKDVFAKVEYPWFRTDQNVVARHAGSATKVWKLDLAPRDPEQYGGQDSSFCFRALRAGCSIGSVRTAVAEHLPRANPEEL